MEIPIRLLQKENFRVLKIIKVEGNEWNHFIGYIFYKRVFTKDYSSQTPDYIDELIFSAISKIYSTASLHLNKDILFESEYEDLMKRYSGNTNKDFTIRFTPDFSKQNIWKLVGKEFTEYHPKFKFNLFLYPQNNNLELVEDFGIGYIPFDKLNDFKDKLKTIDFK